MANEFVARKGLIVLGDTSMTGSLTAASKSFDIPHPTRKGWRLRYGVLEGPEHGVYLRGKTKDNVIILPEYWVELVNEDSISVTLTPIGNPHTHYVKKIENNKIFIDSESGSINAFYLIQAERKDVEKVKIEYKKS